MDFGDYEFKSNYLGSWNYLFSVMDIRKLLEKILVEFVGWAKARNSLFCNAPVN